MLHGELQDAPCFRHNYGPQMMRDDFGVHSHLFLVDLTTDIKISYDCIVSFKMKSRSAFPESRVLPATILKSDFSRSYG